MAEAMTAGPVALRPSLSIDDICARLGGVSRPTAYNFLRDYEIPILRVGKLSRVRPEDLEAGELRALGKIGDAPAMKPKGRKAKADQDCEALA